MPAVLIEKCDNVAVAVSKLLKGEKLCVGSHELTVLEDIDAGHKLALKHISQGEHIIKYGYPIGRATRDISPGETVHTKNIKTMLDGGLEYAYNKLEVELEPVEPLSFEGYNRKNGSVGIRNELWVIPTVGCVNTIAELIAKKANDIRPPSIDGVYHFAHPYGCSQLGDDHENTRKALCGLINHPNAAGVLVLGLGCENNTIEGIKQMLGHGDNERVRFLSCQDVEDEIAEADTIMRELISNASNFKRESIPSSKLIIGLKCGGSDGLSGVSANPLVGEFSDMLIAQGGTTILTEVPEMFGAETILMNRCVSEQVFDKTVRLINDFKDYYLKSGLPVYENPSPGNKAGGISTLEDKSLGCTKKAGKAMVTDVLSYAEPCVMPGLNLLQAPGNDLVASTALAVSGAHIVLFTTGRGTPFGSPVPTVKISSNTPLYLKKRSWIDFDAGPIAEGADKAKLAEEFFRFVLEVASGGRKTHSERIGAREMAIFKNGVTL